MPRRGSQLLIMLIRVLHSRSVTARSLESLSEVFQTRKLIRRSGQTRRLTRQPLVRSPLNGRSLCLHLLPCFIWFEVFASASLARFWGLKGLPCGSKPTLLVLGFGFGTCSLSRFTSCISNSSISCDNLWPLGKYTNGHDKQLFLS
jgi:hypothetical protein